MLRVNSIKNFSSNFNQSTFVSSLNKPEGNDSIKYQYNLASDTISFKRAGFATEDKKIFSCTENSQLAEKVSKYSGVDLDKTVSKKFKNGETYVRLLDNVEEKSVFVINAGNDPINDNLMEFRQMIYAAHENGAEKVVAVLPFLPYSRQDRISEEGEAITAKMVVEDIERSGADKIITFDLHSIQTQGFCDIPMKNISAISLFADYFKSKGDIQDFVVVSPDLGGIKRVETLASKLGTPTAIIHKKRTEHNVAEAVAIFGDVKDKNCILMDDMIDTAGTITEAVKMLKEKGAKDVYICATHGIFSGNAYENIRNCPVKEVVITDTLPLKEGAPENIKQLSISKLIAKEVNN